MFASAFPRASRVGTKGLIQRCRAEIDATKFRTGVLVLSDPAPSASDSGESAAPPPVPDFAAALALQVGVVVVAALYFAREVLIPITFAILLSFVLAPLVDLLRRVKLGRVPSVLLAVLVAIGVLAAVGGIIGSQVAQLATNIPEYAVAIEKKVDTVRNYAIHHLSGLVERLGLGSKPQVREGGTQSAPAGASAPQPELAQPTGPAAPSSGISPLGLIERYLSPVLSPLATFGIILVVAVFVLLQKEDLRDRLIRLFGSTDLHRTTAAMDDAGRRLSRYFLTQLAINSVFGVIIGVGLFFVGIPNPVLWAILSAILAFRALYRLVHFRRPPHRARDRRRSWLVNGDLDGYALCRR